VKKWGKGNIDNDFKKYLNILYISIIGGKYAHEIS